MSKNKVNPQLSKFKNKFLEYFREVPVQKLAAASIGKDETTIIRWKKNDANFANQIEIAKAEWVQEKMKGVKSQEWLLERLMNDHFGEKKKVELEGDLKFELVSYDSTK